ncbi:GAF domain-containing sensor histidine kinase [Methanomassiliicoccus luminyensis]|uniref:GAF domain-containing sensor histidine kinase n=1 Tax=Methanomassiliicoccus luminyensis TaxID=1080712 RepID=UPI0003817458|nr:GAF domain-containing sensor histidine kinase [Methanomassiliicoccus luminyensis]
MVRQEYSRGIVQESLDSFLIREFFYCTGHPMMMFEPEGRCIVANAAASTALRERACVDSIADWSDITAIRGQADVLDRAFLSAVDRKEARKGMAELRPVDRPTMFIGFELEPIFDDRGDVAAIAFSFNEVTDIMQARMLNAVLSDINAELASARSIDEVMDRVLTEARRALESDAAGASLKEGDCWVIRHSVGDLADKKGMTVTDQWLRESLPGLWEDGLVMMETVNLSQIGRKMQGELGLRSVVAIPMTLRGEVVGAMLFPYRRRGVTFTDAQKDFALKLAHTVSLALENAKLLEEERRERVRLQDIIDRSLAGIVVLNAHDHSVVLANAMFKEHMGEVAEGESMDKAVQNMVPESTKATFQEALGRAVQEWRAVRNEEVPVRLCDGTMSYWTYIIAPMSRDGQRTVLLAANDVTGQVLEKEHMRELARKEEEEKSRLRAILNTLPVGVLIVDADGTTAEYNAIRDRIWGHGATPKNIDELSSHEGRWADNGMKLKKNDWPIVRALKKRETVLGEVIDIRRGGGSIGTVIASAAPVIDGKGKIIGAVSVLQDITAQRKLEQEAVQSKDKMELYLDLLSHDVNNLNAAAKGYLELALEREKLTLKAKQYVSNSNDLLDQVSRLIENVRKIQRLETEARSLSLIDLSWMLEEVQHEWEQVPYKEVTIEFQREERRLVLANEILKDVFDNLVGNAVKHSGNDVYIRIKSSTYYEGGKEYHRVDVEDNGPGIPDDAKEKLFQRFVKGKARGHGLGLYLVKRFVEDFNGRVWIEDRIPGNYKKGARFVVLLPVAGIDSGPRVVGIE